MEEKATFSIDGCTYEGETKSNSSLNMRHGIGKQTYEDNSTYEGGWKDGKRDGFGIYIQLSKGLVYQGAWMNDKKNGKGEQIWDDGEKYDGEWKDDRFEGKGNYKWSDNSCYNGRWLEGQMSGLGTFKWPDGRKYSGQFKTD